MIIAILAGMMLLATGSATDSAEATKVINDLRNLKSAALLYYGDTLKWPTGAEVASLDQYSDRPIVKASPSRYVSVKIGSQYTDDDSITRANIGVELKSDTVGVQKKLASKAADSGLLGSEQKANVIYTGGTSVWMNMR
jgi:general secretion pathway protein G